MSFNSPWFTALALVSITVASRVACLEKLLLLWFIFVVSHVVIWHACVQSYQFCLKGQCLVYTITSTH